MRLKNPLKRKRMPAKEILDFYEQTLIEGEERRLAIRERLQNGTDSPNDETLLLEIDKFLDEVKSSLPQARLAAAIEDKETSKTP